MLLLMFNAAPAWAIKADFTVRGATLLLAYNPRARDWTVGSGLDTKYFGRDYPIHWW